MKYTLDGKTVADSEAKQIHEKNMEILDNAFKAGGNISDLLNIQWLFSKEVYDAISEEE